MTQQSIFRRLWQPPARFEDRPRDRRVTFLELFFDLVFVVIIAQLAHRLAEHPSWEGVGWFVFLFYAVWSSWINGTLYHDLHATNDVSVRVFTFAQMLAVTVMAVFVGDVPGDGSVGFALAYGVNTAVLVALWFRTGWHDPSHRPASIPYCTAYLIAAALFFASPLLAEPMRYWIWALALVSEAMGMVVAFYNTVEHAAEPLPDEVRWLLVGSLAVAITSVLLLTLVLEVRNRNPELYAAVEVAMALCAALVLAVGLTGWGAKVSLGVMVVLLLLPLGPGLTVLLRRQAAGSAGLD
ncbi:MAG: low temperature requirement protein A [Thermoanaerobaculia bacterium]